MFLCLVTLGSIDNNLKSQVHLLHPLGAPKPISHLPAVLPEMPTPVLTALYVQQGDLRTLQIPGGDSLAPHPVLYL